MFSPKRSNPDKQSPKHNSRFSFLTKFWRRKSKTRSSSSESRLLQPTQISSDVIQVETETCEVECKSPIPIRQHVLITTHETESAEEHALSTQPRPVLVAPPHPDPGQVGHHHHRSKAMPSKNHP